jgi:hypothetical protein
MQPLIPVPLMDPSFWTLPLPPLQSCEPSFWSLVQSSPASMRSDEDAAFYADDEASQESCNSTCVEINSECDFNAFED